LEKKIMTTIKDIEVAAEEEAAEVKARIDALEAELQALKDQIAGGQVVTEEQMASALAKVRGIFTPA